MECDENIYSQRLDNDLKMIESKLKAKSIKKNNFKFMKNLA